MTIPYINNLYSLFKARFKAITACLAALAVIHFSNTGFAQTKVLTVNEAIEMGLQNSPSLKLSQEKINEANERFRQAKESALPSASASLMFNHAEFLTSEFNLPGNEKPLKLPSSADAYIGTLGIEQLIFAGNKLRYAKESTSLLTQVARLDAEKQKDDIVYAIVNSCYNLYKIEQSQKVLKQNLESVNRQLTQAQQFFDQGIVTKNDVLRYQLQKNNVELTGLDLETNRKIVNYNLDILLGLPENTVLAIKDFDYTAHSFNQGSIVDTALSSRPELKETEIRTQLAENNIKSIRSDLLPTVGLGANLYYIDPSANPFPAKNFVLAPASIAASVKWNIDQLWTSKSRIAEAKIQKSEAEISRRIVSDNIKTEVNRDYQAYLKSVERIKLLESSIEQARENDRILESKYRNNIASVTDRIDAETQLYQSLINLELAKADAGLAYYNLLKSTGRLTSK